MWVFGEFFWSLVAEFFSFFICRCKSSENVAQFRYWITSQECRPGSKQLLLSRTFFEVSSQFAKISASHILTKFSPKKIMLYYHRFGRFFSAANFSGLNMNFQQSWVRLMMLKESMGLRDGWAWQLPNIGTIFWKQLINEWLENLSNECLLMVMPLWLPMCDLQGSWTIIT